MFKMFNFANSLILHAVAHQARSRTNEVETTFEMSGSGSAPASTAVEGETSPGTADVQGAETKAARKRAAEIEHDRQQGVVYYEAYRTLGRLQTFVWINTKGFQKIMKKYDKRQQLRGTGNELGPDFEKRLEKEAFCSGKLEVYYTYYGYTMAILYLLWPSAPASSRRYPYHGYAYYGSILTMATLTMAPLTMVLRTTRRCSWSSSSSAVLRRRAAAPWEAAAAGCLCNSSRATATLSSLN